MGDDEARARATLNEMQLRISQGPYAALGIAQTASPEQVRSAFLELTKQFHPARFARMAPELYRLSNEVFLGIKNAHDQLLKQLGGVRGGGANQSGGIPVAQPGRPPFARGTERATQPVVSRTTTPQSGAIRTATSSHEVPARPATPPPAVGARPGTVQPTPSPGMPARPGAVPPVRPATPQPARTTPAMGTPIMRPVTPQPARPGTPPVRPGTPPAARPIAPPAPGNYNPDTVRHSGVPVFDERTAHREAMIQLNEQDWSAARQTLQQLAQHRPQSKNYGALLAYARGREAQKLGRVSEAMLEYQRALELEPDLAMAKQALAELQRRR